VRRWRRLRAIGAVALKRTVYLLPDTPDYYEHFQWLAQEIQRAGGEATLLRVKQIENMSSGEVVRLFHEARNPEAGILPPVVGDHDGGHRLPGKQGMSLVFDSPRAVLRRGATSSLPRAGPSAGQRLDHHDLDPPIPLPAGLGHL